MNIPVHVATTHPDQSKDDWVYNGLVSLHMYTLLDVYALYKLAAKEQNFLTLRQINTFIVSFNLLNGKYTCSPLLCREGSDKISK